MHRRPVHQLICLALLATSVAGCGAAARSTTRTTVPSLLLQTETTPRLAVLSGDGIGTAHFGAPTASTLTAIGRLLGSRAQQRPSNSGVRGKDACGVDSAASIGNIGLYFFHGRFVGYAYGPDVSLDGSRAHRLRAPELTTNTGFAIGDDWAAGRRLYGGGYTPSGAQGGTWSARSPTGTLYGYLMQDYPASTSASAGTTTTSWRQVDLRIQHGPALSIDAGDVGCPGLSP